MKAVQPNPRTERTLDTLYRSLKENKLSKSLKIHSSSSNFLKVTAIGGEEDTVELQQVVGPASEEEMLNSGFVPDAPEGFEAEVGANSATLSWDKSDCAARHGCQMALARF